MEWDGMGWVGCFLVEGRWKGGKGEERGNNNGGKKAVLVFNIGGQKH